MTVPGRPAAHFVQDKAYVRVWSVILASIHGSNAADAGIAAAAAGGRHVAAGGSAATTDTGAAYAASVAAVVASGDAGDARGSAIIITCLLRAVF